MGEPTGDSPTTGLLIEADVVVQGVAPDRLVVAVGGPQAPGQDRTGAPGLAIHRVDCLQVLVGVGDDRELPWWGLVADGIGQMHAVMTDWYKHASGIGDAVQHVLPAARQRCRAEAEGLLDLDRAGELAPLRVVATAAHLLIE